MEKLRVESVENVIHTFKNFSTPNSTVENSVFYVKINLFRYFQPF